MSIRPATRELERPREEFRLERGPSEAESHARRFTPEDTLTRLSEAPAVAPPVTTLPFHELAQRSLADALGTLRQQVPQLDKTAMPHDASVYALRKSVFRMRTRLDLFSHAFAEHPKAWQRARVMLDAGYEALGQFKDLYDAQGLLAGKRDEKTGAPGGGESAKPVYDPGEVEKRREQALGWKKEFDQALPALEKLLRQAEPLDKPLDRKFQSRFFWGGKTHAPKASATGVANIRRLVHDLTTQAAQEFTDVADLKHLHSAPKQEEFHDFRKRMRVILSVMDNFPEMAGALPEKGLITAIVDRYGLIEDKIVALKLAADRGQKREVARLSAVIDAEWATLRAWQKSADIPAMLESLRARLA